MEKNRGTDRERPAEPMPEPIILTKEQAHQVAAGLAQTVAGLVGKGCSTCGRGGEF